MNLYQIEALIPYRDGGSVTPPERVTDFVHGDSMESAIARWREHREENDVERRREARARNASEAVVESCYPLRDFSQIDPERVVVVHRGEAIR